MFSLLEMQQFVSSSKVMMSHLEWKWFLKELKPEMQSLEFYRSTI